MVMDPQNAWAVMRDGKIAHIRPTKGIAEACASIERDWLSDPNVEIKVVPVLVTEIEDEK